jgi:hypothetical protein
VNNREKATLVWIGVVLVWGLVALPDFRRALVAVVTDLVAPRLAVPLLAMLAYIVGLVYVASRLGLWTSELLSDTMAWTLVAGMGLFGASTSVFERGSSLRRVLLGALGVTALVEVFANLYVLPLIVELILVPVVALAVAISVLSERDDDLAWARTLGNGVVTVVGFAFVLTVAIRLAGDWDGFVHGHGWQRFALPVWLAIGAMPMVAFLGLYSAYDTVLSMVRCATNDRKRRLRAHFALVTGLHLRARDVADFNGMWCKRLTAASSVREAKRVIGRFRERPQREPTVSAA